MPTTPYESVNRKVPTPCVCPKCGSLVNLWYRPDTGAPITLECIHKDWRYHFDLKRKRRKAPPNMQGELC